MDQEEYVRRLEELMGPNMWQEHKPCTPETMQEPLPGSEPARLVHISDEQSSDLPGSPPVKGSLASSASWPETGLAKGERSKQDICFCPWKLVKNYPHSFIGKTNAERAKHFFDNPTIHTHHPWDLYYVHNPGDVKNRHILLVPTYQFEHLLDVINDRLDILLTIPGQKNAQKFKVTFGMGGAPVPRFLGRSTSFEEFEALKRNLPPYNPEDDIRRLSNMAQEDFLELLKRIQTSSKANKSKKSEKKRAQRIQDRKSWGKSTKRVQRYLGIRKDASRTVESGSGTRLGNLASGSQAGTTDVPAEGLEKMTIADAQPTNATTMDVPVVAKPERGVVFVSIDIEAFEFRQDLITEIGMAVFDTLDIDNRLPGENGRNWFPLIRGHHFRIKENAWATNGVHVDGHADKFDFGATQFVAKKRIRNLVADIIENPASLGHKKNKAELGKRPVVLVFHDSASDIKYLETIRYDVTEGKNILEIVDTRDMHQHGVKANNPAGLERVLAELNIPSRFLHNAGNDAVYTMQAMIGLAFKMRQKSLERVRDKNAQGAAAPGEAKDDEGWATGGEDSDGGKPGEKGAPVSYSGGSYLRGKAFQPGEDVFVRAPSPPPSNVFSWSDNEDAEHLEAW